MEELSGRFQGIKPLKRGWYFLTKINRNIPYKI